MMTQHTRTFAARKIIHLDMDAFFASVEQRDFPAYRGKPLVVGGDPNGRGVVAAASYEVRNYGVHSAMSCAQAKQRCPHAIFVRPRFAVYRHVSQQIRAIMQQLTDVVEPLSLDEAYLDVTANTAEVMPEFKGSATLMARWLCRTIFEQTQLTASAGVSYNKMLAKIASDINKPQGIAVITPEATDEFIATLAVSRFHGIGKATARKLYAMGVHTGADLRALSVETLITTFGKRGKFYHDIAHGRDNRRVKSQRIRKSVGSETTFSSNLTDTSALLEKIYQQNADACDQLKKNGLIAKTITLKVKYSDFTQITRSHTCPRHFASTESAQYWLAKLLADVPRQLPIRLVGVTYSSLEKNSHTLAQIDLFE